MTGSRWTQGLKALGASWFALTLDERKALCLILALALLGLAAKAWHVRHTESTRPEPVRSAPLPTR